jgi:hypothetical protein
MMLPMLMSKRANSVARGLIRPVVGAACGVMYIFFIGGLAGLYVATGHGDSTPAQVVSIPYGHELLFWGLIFGLAACPQFRVACLLGILSLSFYYIYLWVSDIAGLLGRFLFVDFGFVFVVAFLLHLLLTLCLLAYFGMQLWRPKITFGI